MPDLRRGVLRSGGSLPDAGGQPISSHGGSVAGVGCRRLAVAGMAGSGHSAGVGDRAQAGGGQAGAASASNADSGSWEWLSRVAGDVHGVEVDRAQRQWRRVAGGAAEWGVQVALDEQVRRVLDALASRSVRFARLCDSIAEESSPPRSTAAAYMVLGNAMPSNADRGVHMAIVCGQAPRCPVAEELAAFLGSLRLPGQAGEASTSQGGKLRSDVENLAGRVGVRLQLGSLAVTGDELEEIAGEN